MDAWGIVLLELCFGLPVGGFLHFYVIFCHAERFVGDGVRVLGERVGWVRVWSRALERWRGFASSCNAAADDVLVGGAGAWSAVVGRDRVLQILPERRVP